MYIKGQVFFVTENVMEGFFLFVGSLRNCLTRSILNKFLLKNDQFSSVHSLSTQQFLLVTISQHGKGGGGARGRSLPHPR